MFAHTFVCLTCRTQRRAPYLPGRPPRCPQCRAAMTQPLLDLPRKAAKAAWTRLDRQREAQAWQAVRSLDWQQAYLATQRAERRLARQLSDLNAETGRSSKAQRRQLARVQRQAKALQVPLSSVQAQATQRRRSCVRRNWRAHRLSVEPGKAYRLI